MVALSEDLRCLVCQNETIAASRADFANDLRREIREQMQANKSDKEIVDFLVARYGDFVLYRPPMKSTTLFLWFGPFIFLLAGAVFLVFYLKRRRKHIEEPALSEQQLLIGAVMGVQRQDCSSERRGVGADCADAKRGRLARFRSVRGELGPQPRHQPLDEAAR